LCSHLFVTFTTRRNCHQLYTFATRLTGHRLQQG
jgi:hypothetical protein